MRRWGLATLAAATLAPTTGCRGATPPSASGGGESSTTTSGAEPLETTETTESTSSSATSESTSGSGSTGPPGREPDYSLCEEPEAIIDLIRATTPVGEVTVAEGWLGVFVCSGVPYFELRLLPLSEDGYSQYLTIAPLDSLSLELPLVGTYPASSLYHRDVDATITFPEPAPLLNPYDAEPSKHVRATIVIEGAEWDFEVDVDFIHCGVFGCDCFCE